MNLYDHLPTPDGALLTVVSFTEQQMKHGLIFETG